MIADPLVKSIVNWLESNVGILITDKTVDNFMTRINVLKDKHNIATLGEIYNRLSDPSQKAFQIEFVNHFTTNYTFFFREQSVLKYLEQNIIAKNFSGKVIKIWSAACSTGQEPYTISMILEKHKRSYITASILATDVDSQALNMGQQEAYSAMDYDSIPDEYKKICVGREKDKPILLPHVKHRVTFRILNLIYNPWPMKNKFDIILCRNVLYYFSEDIKKTLINRFYDILNPGGYLVISVSDSHALDKSKFVKVSNGIFQKVAK